VTYPTLRDDQLDLAPKYGTNKLPETFVLDGDGRVVAISRGETSERFLMDAVQRAGAA
jgi:cytochrome c biogenesis protein CcmG, thiol:disulfide interchange protein DsbE